MSFVLSRMKISCERLLVLAFAGVFAWAVEAGVQTADFSVPEQVGAVGWDLTHTDWDSGTTNPGRKFTNDGDEATSPVYGGSVVQVYLTAKCVSMDKDAPSCLTLLGRDGETGEWQTATTVEFQNGSATNIVLNLARAKDYRQFRVRFDKGSGTMRLSSFTAVWREEDEVAAPYDLVVSEATANGFCATWQTDEPVEGYLFYLWREDWIGWRGNVVWGETFAGCENTGRNPKAIMDEQLDSMTDQVGWRGENLYLPAESVDVIQINKASSTTGWLESAALPRMSGVTLVVRACAHTMQPDHVMPVYLVKGNETNECARLELTAEMKDYEVPTLDIAAGDRLLFRSFVVGSQRRVLVEAIRLVESYVPGCTATNWIVNGASTAEAIWRATGLETNVAYRFAVRSVMGAHESEMSDVCSVMLSTEANPPEGAADVSLLRLERRNGRFVWRENFDRFAHVYPDSGNSALWVNGMTLPFWQLYEGDEAPDSLSRNMGAATVTGFYAYWATNKVVDSYALGTLTGSGKPAFVYGVAFCNDTPGDMRKVALRYDGVQFGFKNTGEQTLQCEWLVTNEEVSVVAPGDWHTCDALRFTTPVVGGGGLEGGKDLPVSSEYSVDDLGVKVPRGSRLLVRWRRTAATSAAAMAIDNIEVAFESAIQPTVVIFR